MAQFRDLIITGPSRFIDNLSIGGNLSVNGNGDFSYDLSSSQLFVSNMSYLTGPVDMGSTLNVGGLTTLTEAVIDAVTVEDIAQFNGDITVGAVDDDTTADIDETNLRTVTIHGTTISTTVETPLLNVDGSTFTKSEIKLQQITNDIYPTLYFRAANPEDTTELDGYIRLTGAKELTISPPQKNGETNGQVTSIIGTLEVSQEGIFGGALKVESGGIIASDSFTLQNGSKNTIAAITNEGFAEFAGGGSFNEGISSNAEISAGTDVNIGNNLNFQNKLNIIGQTGGHITSGVYDSTTPFLNIGVSSSGDFSSHLTLTDGNILWNGDPLVSHSELETKVDSLSDKYLSLSGGTVTGDTTFNRNLSVATATGTKLKIGNGAMAGLEISPKNSSKKALVISFA